MNEMPLEELKNYMGTNPIPEDFDEFWDKQVKRADQHPLKYEITESEITGFDTVSCYDIWFNGITGNPVYAKYIRPHIDKKVPLIMQYHGYPGASRPWFEQIVFAGMGYALIAMDCAGQGGKTLQNGAYMGPMAEGHIIMGIDGPAEAMYYVITFLNALLISRIGEQLEGIDTQRIYCNGASQGAGLSCAVAALNPNIKRCALLYPYLSDYKRVWELNMDLAVYEGLRYYSRWFDQLHAGDAFFEKLGYIDAHNFAHRIKAEVLFGSGLKDIFCPPSTHFAVYNNIHSKKRMYIFPDYGHEEIGAFDNLIIDFFAEGGRE